jgi:hypothetical protein
VSEGGDLAGLDELLDYVRRADRTTRIEHRNAIAAYGDQAIDPMVEWLDDREFGAFAVRVLERIAAVEGARKQVIDALAAALPDAPSVPIAGDIQAALTHLGARSASTDRPPRPHAPRPQGRPGLPGRRYWAMRTGVSRPDVVWREARAGRLRQGWGWAEEQSLERIARVLRAGGELTDWQRQAWPARRMLTTEPDGIRLDDLVVTQNLPRHAHISVFRVVGPYGFEVPSEHDDYGHYLQVELLVGDVSRYDPWVSDALRHAIKLRPRLYEITPYGGEVEALITAARDHHRGAA